jgi:hypothetical protein
MALLLSSGGPLASTDHYCDTISQQAKNGSKPAPGGY